MRLLPNVVRNGVNLLDDVFQIPDTAPIKRKRQPKPEVAIDPETGALIAPAFDPNAAEEEMYEQEEIAAQPSGALMAAVQTEIIQVAMTEAAQIMKEAAEEAENQRQEILARVHLETEMLKKEAEEQGKKQGFAAVIGEMQDTAKQLEQAIARFEGDRAGFEVEYEQQLKWMAFEIAAKVLNKKVAEDDTEMLAMVQKAVQGVQNEAWVRVEVAQEMTHLIGELAGMFDGQQNIQVSAIPAETGTVQIETPAGVVDASLKTQLMNLKDYFKKAGG